MVTDAQLATARARYRAQRDALAGRPACICTTVLVGGESRPARWEDGCPVHPTPGDFRRDPAVAPLAVPADHRDPDWSADRLEAAPLTDTHPN